VSWTVVSAISTMLSALVVAGSVLVAVFQLRDARRAAQFDATRRMIDGLFATDFYYSLLIVVNDLPQRLQDQTYRQELEGSRGWDLDPQRHPELVVLARLEEMGVYLRHRLVARTALLDVAAELILESWERLVPVVELMRHSHRNPRVWSNAESLYTYVKVSWKPHQRSVTRRMS